MADKTLHSIKFPGLTDIYKIPDIVSEYSSSSAYAIGDYVTKDGKTYKCTTAIASGEAWTSAHWSEVKIGNDLKGQVTDLKSAIDEKIPTDKYGNLYTNKLVGVTTVSSGTKLQLYGSSVDNPNSNYLTACIPISPNTKYTVAFDEATDRIQIVTASNKIEMDDFRSTNPIDLSNYSLIASQTNRSLKKWTFTSDASANYLYIASTETGETDAYIYVVEGEASEALYPKSWVKWLDAYNKNQIDTITEPLNNRVSRVIFNGATSKCTVDSIVLQNEGDSLEVEILPSSNDNNKKWSFASRTNGANIAIAASKQKLAVRAADDTWLCQETEFSSTEKNKYILRIVYTSGNILIYVDNDLIKTYVGQKKIEITEFGKNNNYNYWAGSIGYININGTRYNNVSELTGYDPTDLVVLYPYGWLTEDQYNLLLSDSNKIVVIPTSGKVSVYFSIGSKYGCIEIGHENNHADDPYVDYWRINESTVCERNYDGTFTPSIDKLVVGAENEMAMSFSGMGDFTGGYHGDERIDLDNNCYVVFIVDGQEYSITDLVALGQFECTSFGYREVSQLFASYSYNTAHLPIAKHTKITMFKDKGFETTNCVEIDLAEFDHQTIQIIQPFTGLFCIGSAFANFAINDVGTKFTATHPVTTTTLAEEMNVYSLWAKTYKNNYSCEMDSELLHTNINEYMNPAIDVDMMDRQTDLKYYSYLPNYVNVETGDYFATRGRVSFNIND